MDTHARALFALCTVLTACTTVTTSSSPGGDGGPPSDAATAAADGGAIGTGALSCGAILDCVGKCATNDSACADACLAKGSPPAKDAVNNLASCYQENACNDSTCIQTKCAQELQACVQSASTGTQPLDGSAPTGSVPADLVGEWFGTEEGYSFKADGTLIHSVNVNSGSCQTSELDTGTAVVSGSTLTVYLTNGAIKICGSTSNDPFKPVTNTFIYRIETKDVGIVLTLAQQNCQYTDQPSIDLYCTNGYDKGK